MNIGNVICVSFMTIYHKSLRSMWQTFLNSLYIYIHCEQNIVLCKFCIYIYNISLCIYKYTHIYIYTYMPSFLLCCPCEALEGPISTRVGII